jgi:hypothetical protein
MNLTPLFPKEEAPLQGRGFEGLRKYMNLTPLFHISEENS